MGKKSDVEKWWSAPMISGLLVLDGSDGRGARADLLERGAEVAPPCCRGRGE